MPHDPHTTHVIVLAGGTSAEREISLLSGDNVCAALAEAGYRVTCLDPAEAGWIAQLAELASEGRTGATPTSTIVFPVLHGRGGEDGTVQGLCELLEVPYVGSDVRASASAAHKPCAKHLYRAHGIPTPAFVEVSRAEFEADRDRAIVAQSGQPETYSRALVVKPAVEGSSLGMTILHNPTSEDIGAALEAAFVHDDTVLIEQFISGIELTVPVIGTAGVPSDSAHAPYALPVIQLKLDTAAGQWYDYVAKYEGGNDLHLIPAPIDKDLTARVQELAVRAHNALGCGGISRTDFIIAPPDNTTASPVIYALETNTIPGLTHESLVPDSARAAGIDMPTLCATLIEFSVAT